MSVVTKIPPLISALAFGYGVGMAAPESAIHSMQDAARAPMTQPRYADVRGVLPPPLPSGTSRGMLRTGSPTPGDESRELGRLRDVGGREGRRGGEACDLDRPTYSRAPRYESRRDREAYDVDDLDDAGTDALSRLQLPDLKGAVTRRTLKYVRFFTRTDRGRRMFETWLKRSGRYQDLIQAELRERRMPEDLIWVSMIESGFDPRAKSPAGAMGLWQFMPATGEVYGLQQSRTLDQRKNPKLATQAAAHHLRDLYLRFGSWDLALAAYNMGYEQLLDAIDRYGTTDFNELARQEAIPDETAAYVPKIMAAAIVANNLAHFGFDEVALDKPVDAAEIAVPPGTPLKTLAKAAGVSTATIRNLNPDVLGDRVPPGRGDYLLMIPPEALARAQAALPPLLDSAPADDASVLDPVDLVGGRDAETVKRRLRDDDSSLLSLLPAPRRHKMRGALVDRDDDDDDDLLAARRKRKGRETVMYKVGSGDSLVGIAKQFAVDVDDLARDNGLDADAKLREGALLRMRVKKDLVDPAGAAAAPEADRHDKPGKARDEDGSKDAPKGKSKRRDRG